MSKNNYKKFNLGFVFKAPIIGLGAQTNTCLALGVGRDIILSQTFSDLKQPEDLEEFQKTLKKFIRIAKVKRFAYDLHPDYTSTQIIRENLASSIKDCRLFAIQHHHAHIAACLLEHNIRSKVIGVAFDGTGFGLDNNLWGGEFFIADFKNCQRVAHLEYLPLIGGEQAILEPWRLTWAMLYRIYGDKFLNLKIDFLKIVDKNKWPYLNMMLEKNINCFSSSSAGRLFDAVSALLGLVKSRISYEAQGPIKLEKLANSFNDLKSPGLDYNYKVKKLKDVYIIDPAEIIKAIVFDLEKNIDLSKIAFKFHNTLAKIILDICIRINKQSGLNKVVLSGGVFQNKLLSNLTRELLVKAGFSPFEHKIFSSSDASICLGQIAVASKRER
jgi:hydrogenase maturation protein HypF